jgi:hypothetical protein
MVFIEVSPFSGEFNPQNSTFRRRAQSAPAAYGSAGLTLKRSRNKMDLYAAGEGIKDADQKMAGADAGGGVDGAFRGREGVDPG